MAWLPAVLTFTLPGLLVAGAVLCFLAADLLAPAVGLALAFPLGLLPGYLLAGAPGRGGWVVAGAYGLLAAGVLLLAFTPTQFEDAGVLVAFVIGAIGVGLAGYAGWAAWDVFHLAAPRP